MDLGERELSGFAGPMRAWRVLAARFAGSRFEAAQPLRTTPLVDRAEQLGWLLKLWEELEPRRGRAALLSGEAGIGKSRVIEALRERIEGAPHALLRYQCSPHYANRAWCRAPMTRFPCSGRCFPSRPTRASRCRR
jgi:hypothetical protein